MEATAPALLHKGVSVAGTYLVRLDAELSTFNLLYMLYHCKLQSLALPAPAGTPYTDLPGTNRMVSWRLGNTTNETGSGVSIGMQTTVTAGASGVDVRLVCWSTVDGTPQLYDYGLGLTSAVLTLLPVSGVG